jgi:PAS domain S-box-containing protein
MTTMQLDPRTLATVTVAAGLLLALYGVVIWWTRRTYPGQSRWTAGGLLLLMSQCRVILWPRAPDPITLVVTNTMTVIASILFLEGAREFRGVPSRSWLVTAGGVVAVAAGAFFSYAVPSTDARVSIMSPFVGIVFILASIQLLKGSGPEPTFGIMLTSSMFALCGAVLMARALYIHSARPLSVLPISGINGALYASFLATVAGFLSGIALLADERAKSDIADAKDKWSRAQAEVAERRRAEAVLRESEERFRNMADTAPVMIWVSDADGNCTFMNSPWLEFTGRSLENELGQGWIASIHPEDLDRCFQAVSSSPHGHHGFRIECRVRRADGEYRWVLCNALPRFQAGGALLGHIGSCVDITDLKRAQEEALARQKLESVGTLASGIAHDFNNLLGAVLAQAEVASRELADGVRPFEELEAIRAVANRGAEIVRELMIYVGQESEVLQSADLSDIVEEMVDLLKVSASKHARLETSLDKNLPTVRANPAQLRQLVMNLVTNASDAIGDRDGVIRVTTGCVTIGPDSSGMNSEPLTEGDYLCLEVSDTGCGIPWEAQTRVFDPFFSTKAAGRGLGLAVVQGVVRGLRGAIHLESEPGKGTRFQILLPMGETAAGGTEGTTPNIGHAVRSSWQAAVLVVEDEDPLRQAVSKMLRKTGFSVIEASDGSAALEAIRGHTGPIDLLFLDITLPGTPSRVVFEEAKRLRPEMSVIVTSAYSQETAGASLQTEVERFLRKPYRLAATVDMIRQTLKTAPPGCSANRT